MRPLYKLYLLVVVSSLLVSCSAPSHLTLQDPYPAPYPPLRTPTSPPAPIAPQILEESYPAPSIPTATFGRDPYPPPYTPVPTLTPGIFVPQSTPTYEPTVVQNNTVIVTLGDSTRTDARRVQLRVGQYLQIKRRYSGPGWQLAYNTTLLGLAAGTNVSSPPPEEWIWQAKATGTTTINLRLVRTCSTIACPPIRSYDVIAQIVP